MLPTLTRFAAPGWEADAALKTWCELYVDPLFASASPQHPMRRWEYAMALQAIRWWWSSQGPGDKTPSPQILDVGGAGSPLGAILVAASGGRHHVRIVDPAGQTPNAAQRPGLTLVPVPLEQLQLPAPADALFSISVLEHVDDPYSFLEACCKHLRPGGLLFLTVDAWDQPTNQPDRAHFHWMRKRIFNPETVEHVLEILRELGCMPFGGIDLTYRGATVFDYSFASICCVKEGA